MLVLNHRLSLLASLLTLLALSSAPSPVSSAAIRARDDAPSTTTSGTTFTPIPVHQDRPSELGLPDGAEPDSAASRKGMGNGRWASRGSHTWTGTWTGTRTGGWARPTPTGEPAGGEDDDEGLSKRSHGGSKVVVKGKNPSSRRGHARRALAGGFLKHGAAKHSRSITINKDEGGERYVVQKDKASSPSAKKSYTAYQQRRFLMRRNKITGTPGVINIMSHVYNAEPGKKIASLYLEDNHKGDASGYILNASEKDSSEIYLVSAVPSDGGSHVANAGRRRSEDSKKEVLVNLRMEINQELFCATYDPNPPEAEPLTMQRCMTDADVSDDGNQTPAEEGKNTDPNNHKSQTFSFDPESGVIRPMWFAGEDDGKTDSLRAHANEDGDASVSSSVGMSSTVSAADAGETSSSSSTDSASSTDAAATAEDVSSTASATPSSSDSAAAPSPSATGASGTIASREPSAQNVTLVFVPSSKPAAANAADAPASTVSGSAVLPSASSASAAGDDSDSSSVLPTKTVTVTLGATAAADETGSTASSTATTDGPVAAATDGGDASTTTTITISASDLPSPTAGAGQGTLNVQVVGSDGKTIGDDDPNTADDSASASGSADAAAETPSSSTSPSVSGSAAAADASPSPSSTSPTPVSAANDDSTPTTTSAPGYTTAVDPMAVASEVAQSWSASQSASMTVAAADASETSSPSSNDSTPGSSPPPSPSSSPEPKSEVVAAKNRAFNSRVARRSPMMTPVSTAPYKWLFNLAGI